MDAVQETILRKNAVRLLPLLTFSYIINYLDRTNISVAALTMNKDIGLTATQYGRDLSVEHLHRICKIVVRAWCRSGAGRLLRHTVVTVPASPRALPDLLASDEVIGDGRPALLWLDELARYLTVPRVGPALFERVRAKREANGQTVVVLATLNLTESGALLGATGEIGRSMREILGSAFEVTVPSEMSPAERERAVSS